MGNNTIEKGGEANRWASNNYYRPVRRGHNTD